jgi:hypothetical protein
MRWTPGVAAAVALVVAQGACGSQITVPDQGVIVSGCQQPSQCFLKDCPCTRAALSTLARTTPCTDTDPNDPSTCDCLPLVDDGMLSHETQCLETAMACIGRGVFCGGAGALCKPPGSTCDGTGDPPMIIPTIGLPMLEPHCQFVDDVCCPGSSDGGVTTD